MSDNKPKVAFLGPENSFHHETCKSYFGGNFTPIFKDGFIEIIESTQSGIADYGVIAIENSNAGLIDNNIELIIEHGLKVVAEIKLRIHLFLASKYTMPTDKISDIYSHPAIFQQCSHYLNSLNHIQLHKVNSSAKAAQIVSEKGGTTATICGKPAINKYQLQIIEVARSDKPENTTRFFIIHAGNKTIEIDEAQPCLISVYAKPGDVILALQNQRPVVVANHYLQGLPHPLIELEAITYTDAKMFMQQLNALSPQVTTLVGIYPKSELIVNT